MTSDLVNRYDASCFWQVQISGHRFLSDNSRVWPTHDSSIMRVVARRPVIAVIGAGRDLEPAVSNARDLGRLIAENGWVLISGGRDVGVMNAANAGAKEVKDSLTIGILPDRTAAVSAFVDVAIIRHHHANVMAEVFQRFRQCAGGSCQTAFSDERSHFRSHEKDFELVFHSSPL